MDGRLFRGYERLGCVTPREVGRPLLFDAWRGRERTKSMVHPIFAILIFDGELACLNLFGVAMMDCSPRHDEIRA
jgi:hypothetical protein